MAKTLKAIIVLILLAGWALAAASLYVVRTDTGVIGVVPKNRLAFTDTYLDVRTWGAKEAAEHPDFVRRLLAADKAHWLQNVGSAAELTRILEKGPPASQPTSLPPIPAIR